MQDVFRFYDGPLGRMLATAKVDGGGLTGLYFEGGKHNPLWPQDLGRQATSHAVFDAACRQLDLYFEGALDKFDLPLAPEGTEFQRRVWAQLVRIPYGDLWTYGDLAAAIGSPKASRAVGGANARNPIAIIVPCHRVAGGDGGLTGYASGLGRKAALLQIERGSPCNASGDLFGAERFVF